MKTLLFCFPFALLLISACSHTSRDWRTADRSPMGLAPLPEATPEAIVQVYYARAVRWRGTFAVHSWVSIKEKDAPHYTNYHVVGFRVASGGSAIRSDNDFPDRRWYGSEPTLLTELRGARAEEAILKVKAAVASYPYPSFYRIYPGPNSNTFTSHILRNVPELGVELPPHAIGKDWIRTGGFFAITESGTGVQFSTFGLLGLSLGLAEGVELNVLGMNFGLDLWRPALKLPFVGRIGFKDDRVWD